MVSGVGLPSSPQSGRLFREGEEEQKEVFKFGYGVWVVVVYDFNASLQEAEASMELEASLVYRGGSRIGRAT